MPLAGPCRASWLGPQRWRKRPPKPCQPPRGCPRKCRRGFGRGLLGPPARRCNYPLRFRRTSARSRSCFATNSPGMPSPRSSWRLPTRKRSLGGPQSIRCANSCPASASGWASLRREAYGLRPVHRRFGSGEGRTAGASHPGQPNRKRRSSARSPNAARPRTRRFRSSRSVWSAPARAGAVPPAPHRRNPCQATGKLLRKR